MSEKHPTSQEREHPRWHKIVAAITALALGATLSVPNRPMDPVLREQSYSTEALGGLPGTGGKAILVSGTPDTNITHQVVTQPSTTEYDTFTVGSYRNKPADSTPNIPAIKGVEDELRQIEANGWDLTKVWGIGDSSDFIVRPNSLGKPEPKVAKPQQDWSNERAEVASSLTERELDGTPFGNLPVGEKTDQDVLTKTELKKFGKIAKSLGYDTPHSLTSAVIGGRETRPEALDTVNRYILSEMGVRIVVNASRTTPAHVVEIIEHIPGTPPRESPYYNPVPAARWGQSINTSKPGSKLVIPPGEEDDTVKPKDPRVKIVPNDRSDRTVNGRSVAATRHHKQPAQSNNNGNSGPRGQTNIHGRSMHNVRAGR